MTFRRYEFTITVDGYGDTPEQAWDDFVSNAHDALQIDVPPKEAIKECEEMK